MKIKGKKLYKHVAHQIYVIHLCQVKNVSQKYQMKNSPNYKTNKTCNFKLSKLKTKKLFQNQVIHK
jgi:hypothetical protein